MGVIGMVGLVQITSVGPSPLEDLKVSSLCCRRRARPLIPRVALGSPQLEILEVAFLCQQHYSSTRGQIK